MLFLFCAVAPEGHSADTTNLYARWENGPSVSENFFPIAVWLQSPSKAAQYLAAGINTYVGLWKGPTEDQLTTLKRTGMKVICSQNEVGLKHLDDPTIIGWMHGDEPDNAQSLGEGNGYGPPIAPEKIIADYQQIRSRDPSRPVLLNLGQAVAWDNYIGRGATSLALKPSVQLVVVIGINSPSSQTPDPAESTARPGSWELSPG